MDGKKPTGKSVDARKKARPTGTPSIPRIADDATFSTTETWTADYKRVTIKRAVSAIKNGPRFEWNAELDFSDCTDGDMATLALRSAVIDAQRIMRATAPGKWHTFNKINVKTDLLARRSVVLDPEVELRRALARFNLPQEIIDNTIETAKKAGNLAEMAAKHAPAEMEAAE